MEWIKSINSDQTCCQELNKFEIINYLIFINTYILSIIIYDYRSLRYQHSIEIGKVENGLNIKHNMTNVNANISRIQSEMATYLHIKKQFKLKRVKRLERGRLIWETGAKSIYFDLVSSCIMLDD